MRLCDLADRDALAERVDALLLHHNALLAGLGEPGFERDELIAGLLEIAPKVLPFAERVWQRLDDARRANKRILFEGAQGAMLDVDHGTYPYVTSSNTLAGQAAAGAGMAVSALDYVLGITKAYTTRVGAGPFPTELDDDTGRLLGERGREFGTVTGRRRRCGWFDAVLVRQAVMVGGIDGIALTKLDVLDGLPELKVSTAYRLDGEEIGHLPALGAAQARVEPVYERFEGWRESTQGARSWADLPATAIKYIRRIEELIEAPVALLVYQPRAGRYDPGARSLRALTRRPAFDVNARPRPRPRPRTWLPHGSRARSRCLARLSGRRAPASPAWRRAVRPG